MTEKNKYRIINIRRYIGNENPELGEDELFQILSEFSCPLNPDVEWFLKHSSIEFTKKNQSVTYLVFSVSDGKLLGYLAWDKIKATQYMFGGMVTFLETENEERLLSFYRDNRFSQFDTRQTASDAEESHELVQLLRLL